MRKKCVVFFCLITFISCGNKDKIPAGILKPDKMQAVLWDIIRANAFTTEIIKKDSSKNPVEVNLTMQREIFAIHQITRDNFYKSYDYYKTNPAKMKVMMDSMIIQADRNRYKNFSIKPVQSN